SNQGGAMAISTWVAFTGTVEEEIRTGIIDLLERSDIRTCTLSETQGGGLGLVVFDMVDDCLFSLLQNEHRTTAVLAVSVSGSTLTTQTLWSLIHAGARDVLEWPSLPKTAEDIACRLHRWSMVEALLDSHQVSSSLVGASAGWRSVMRGIVEAAAFTSSSILITGESGTGKERIARLIHDLDPRRDTGSFVVVDCTTILPGLSGSEFFGHERGAFTGATTARDGAFALANKGTLFLDEVGELSPELQAQLLRVVQEHKFKRVGSNTWETTELRLISATNRDLEHCVANGGFRADLFYRIAGWRCRTLPLRDRKEDILPLAQHFISQLLPRLSGVSIESAVHEFLITRDYPGNVRDLQQLVTRICHCHAGNGPITIGDIPLEDRVAIGTASAVWPESNFRSAVRMAVELRIGMKQIAKIASELAVEQALECENGNLQRAASRLGVTDRALQIRRAGQPAQM
ncbi:MAG: sigma 54-interacting transcriptional regulator, partial [Rhodopila sp.]